MFPLLVNARNYYVQSRFLFVLSADQEVVPTCFCQFRIQALYLILVTSSYSIPLYAILDGNHSLPKHH